MHDRARLMRTRDAACVYANVKYVRQALRAAAIYARARAFMFTARAIARVLIRLMEICTVLSRRSSQVKCVPTVLVQYYRERRFYKYVVNVNMQ